MENVISSFFFSLQLLQPRPEHYKWGVSNKNRTSPNLPILRLWWQIALYSFIHVLGISDSTKTKYITEIYKENNFDNNTKTEVDNWYEHFFARHNPNQNIIDIQEDEYYEIVFSGKNTAPGHDYVSRNWMRKLTRHSWTYIQNL